MSVDFLEEYYLHWDMMS